MKNYIEIAQSIANNKEAKKYGLIITLAVCLLVIGRLSASDPIRSEFCKKEMLSIESLNEKNNLLKSSVLELEDQISKIQKDRYRKEVEITESERKECNVRIAKKIKSIKKLYLDAKCKICKR